MSIFPPTTNASGSDLWGCQPLLPYSNPPPWAGQIPAGVLSALTAEAQDDGVRILVKQVANGYTVSAGGKTYIAPDHDELLKVFTLILVSNKLGEAL